MSVNISIINYYEFYNEIVEEKDIVDYETVDYDDEENVECDEENNETDDNILNIDDIFNIDFDEIPLPKIQKPIFKKLTKYSPEFPDKWHEVSDEFSLNTRKEFSIITKYLIIENVLSTSVRSVAQSFYNYIIPEMYALFAIKDLNKTYYFFKLKIIQHSRYKYPLKTIKKIPEFAFKLTSLTDEDVKYIVSNRR
jgi:hypothetical protein